MKEEFLQFVWEHQLFNAAELKCTNARSLKIISPGQLNRNSGPDFHTGYIKLGSQEWVGNIEIHVYASEWELHRHQYDEAYDNVILHVVFEEDKHVKSSKGTMLPCLELKHRIELASVLRFENLLHSDQWVPCQKKLPFVDKRDVSATIADMLKQRLSRKSNDIQDLLKLNLYNWEEALYVTLANSFGFKLNAMPFSLLAKSISYSQIRKYHYDPFLIECLLFGQAGFLNQDFKDPYPRALKKEFQHQKNKLDLRPFPDSIWKKSKMRPNNFPVLRIAQFAALMANKNDLSSLWSSNVSLKDMRKRFEIELLHPYWRTHSDFDRRSSERSAKIGASAIDSILINTIVPFVFLKGLESKDNALQNHAVNLLKEIGPESNSIIRKWRSLGIKVGSAADSQALLELKNEHCSYKKCVSCGIGTKLIKAS